MIILLFKPPASIAFGMAYTSHPDGAHLQGVLHLERHDQDTRALVINHVGRVANPFLVVYKAGKSLDRVILNFML